MSAEAIIATFKKEQALDYKPSLLLLQYLIRTQQDFSFVPDNIIRELSQQLGIPEAEIRGVISFYSFLHETPRGPYDILFSDNITDRMQGSQQFFKQLQQALAESQTGGKTSLDTTSCIGMCDQGPAMLVNGYTITNLDKNRVSEISHLIYEEKPLEQWPAEFFQVKDNIRQPGLLLESVFENGSALQALLHADADSVLKTIEDSGLRGRGGAGFPTARKWTFCKQAPGEDRVVICNADEGEPGTFKDRVLLSSFADAVFEGMTLCAGIIGASQGYLYLRGEYRYLVPKLTEVLQQRRKAGLLGKNILGQPGFDFDIDIHLGAGAYICGEESALIESLEGKRGIPRKRPPFPVNQGYNGLPTVVNNVETFMAAACITEHDAGWFRSQGTQESAGSKILSISGDCDKPGIYEVPLGTSINQILKDCGAANTQAVQVAGAAGSLLPPAEFGRSISFEDAATAGSFMIYDQSRDLLDIIDNFSHFFVHESCGFCTPCRVGTSLLKDLNSKLINGHATTYDLNEMRTIGSLMKTSSFCGLGATAATALTCLLDKFPELVSSKLAHSDYEPAFDLDAALQASRDITGRDDKGAHFGAES